MIPKTFDNISKSDIEALIQNKVREGRTIEYKLVLPGNSDKDKREFLADISSFANAGGGDLLYGISEQKGIAQVVLGLEGNLDDGINRLENLKRTSINPRVHGLQMKPVEGFEKGPVLLVRVANSWIAPHMVTFKGSSRFFTRNSAGKHQMDTLEIRNAFLLSDALPEKMRRFRDERLGKIIANETPVSLSEGAKVILHVLPVASFTTGTNFDVSVLKEHARHDLEPIRCREYSHRYNLDGFVNYNSFIEDAGSKSKAYSMVFRKGQIEAVASNLFVDDDKGRKVIGSEAYEDYIIGSVLGYLRVLKSLEIPSPLVLFLSMIGVANVCMGVDKFCMPHGGTPIDRDTLILPDILIEDYESITDRQAVATVLRPIFDAVWNACGFEHSYNYDDDGNWVRKR